MDFSLTSEQLALQDSVRSLMKRTTPPEVVRACEREGRFPDDLFQAWVEVGLLALPFPSSVGGLDGNAIDLAIVAEEIARVSPDLAMSYGGTVLCGLNLLHHGTDEQVATWIPRVVQGEVKFSVGISEPDAGSDALAMRTKARQSGDAWVIDGQKLWTTGAGLPDGVINVYARTSGKRSEREGISVFLVDNDTPGVHLRKLDMLSRRSSGTYEVVLDGVEVPSERLVGQEGNGWSCLTSGLQIERTLAAANSVGGSQAVVDLAVAYAKERTQFGKPIGTFQAIGHTLADMQTEVDAARLMMWRAAWLTAEGRKALKEITMAKLIAGETFAKVAGHGVQVMGAYGLNAEFDMERYFRDARSSTIAAGSSQTQRNLIAGLMGFKQR
ncbi:acyl-CoA dehydrogenase family protein [Rhodococcus opacus]|uniref:acyl-CoA dehydrogenase family protein n=1 Tax=Rhodococcus opacus TaxID=37919 RepID=UPI00155B0270|nr:acyl-CoA dehydrogenase family protein [Rhodococcus opacus]